MKEPKFLAVFSQRRAMRLMRFEFSGLGPRANVEQRLRSHDRLAM
jgi:hypothetical protein